MRCFTAVGLLLVLGALAHAAEPGVLAVGSVLEKPGSTPEHFTALRTLRNLGPVGRHAIGSVAKSLEVPALRLHALETCEAIGPGADPATNSIAKLLADTDPLMRIGAARALGAIGPEAKDTVAGLTPLLADSNVDVRRQAALALAAIGPAAAPAYDKLVALLKDPSRGVQMAALQALGRLGPGGKAAVPLLVERLADPARAVRLAAARALGDLAEHATPAVPALLERLGDPDADVQTAAADSLRKIKPSAEQAAPKLIEALGDVVGERFVSPNIGRPRKETYIKSLPLQKALARTLASLPGATPAIVKALGDSNPHIRGGAALALGQVRPEPAEADALLRKALEDQSFDARMAAGRGLAHLLAGRDNASTAIESAFRALEAKRDFHQDSGVNLRFIGFGILAEHVQDYSKVEALLRTEAARGNAIDGAFHQVIRKHLAQRDELTATLLSALDRAGADRLQMLGIQHSLLSGKPNVRTVMQLLASGVRIDESSPAVLHLLDTNEVSEYLNDAIFSESAVAYDPRFQSVRPLATWSALTLCMGELGPQARSRKSLEMALKSGCDMTGDRAPIDLEDRSHILQALLRTDPTSLPIVLQGARGELDYQKDWNDAKLLVPHRAAAVRALRWVLSPSDDVRKVLRAAVLDQDIRMNAAALAALLELAPRDKASRALLDEALGKPAEAMLNRAISLREMEENGLYPGEFPGRVFEPLGELDWRQRLAWMIGADCPPATIAVLCESLSSSKGAGKWLAAGVLHAALAEVSRRGRIGPEHRRAAASLMAAVKDSDPGVRAESAGGLGALARESEALIPELVRLSGDSSPKVRAIAIHRMAPMALSSELVLGIAVTKLADSDPLVFQAASDVLEAGRQDAGVHSAALAAALDSIDKDLWKQQESLPKAIENTPEGIAKRERDVGRILAGRAARSKVIKTLAAAGPSAAPVLATRLNDGESVNALLSMGPAAVAAIQKVANDPSSTQKSVAEELLRGMGVGAAGLAPDKADLEELAKRAKTRDFAAFRELSKRKEFGILIESLETKFLYKELSQAFLDHGKDALPHLEKGLKHQNVQVRQNIIKLLRSYKADGLVLLVAALRDPDEEVVTSAYNALIGSGRANRKLVLEELRKVAKEATPGGKLAAEMVDDLEKN